MPPMDKRSNACMKLKNVRSKKGTKSKKAKKDRQKAEKKGSTVPAKYFAIKLKEKAQTKVTRNK